MRRRARRRTRRARGAAQMATARIPMKMGAICAGCGPRACATRPSVCRTVCCVDKHFRCRLDGRRRGAGVGRARAIHGRPNAACCRGAVACVSEPPAVLLACGIASGMISWTMPLAPSRGGGGPWRWASAVGGGRAGDNGHGIRALAGCRRTLICIHALTCLESRASQHRTTCAAHGCVRRS